MTEQQAKEIIQLLRQINEKLPELQKPKYETKVDFNGADLRKILNPTEKFDKAINDEKTEET